MAGVSDKENKKVAKNWIIELDPKSVLDIGAGQGTYSKLAKQKGQYWHALEIFYPYVRMYKLAKKYHRITIGDARYMDYDKLSVFQGWHLIIAADMLEHMTKEDAKLLIYELSKHCKHLLICFPVEHQEQHAGDEGNDYETHIDHWTADEMEMYLNSVAELPIVKSLVGNVLAYYLVKGKLE
jgi:cyclopropane fatty-acyl-phospholipid synthase-like methyltransferase